MNKKNEVKRMIEKNENNNDINIKMFYEKYKKNFDYSVKDYTKRITFESILNKTPEIIIDLIKSPELNANYNEVCLYAKKYHSYFDANIKSIVYKHFNN
ncbi:MAG TPA: hypothetical protein VIH61_05575 [Waddliaceae bacterium]